MTDLDRRYYDACEAIEHERERERKKRERICKSDVWGKTTSSCDNPKHVTTRNGITWLHWRCETCGGTGEAHWD